jgi:hypothetical protein
VFHVGAFVSFDIRQTRRPVPCSDHRREPACCIAGMS